MAYRTQPIKLIHLIFGSSAFALLLLLTLGSVLVLWLNADIKTTLMSDKFIVINIVQNQDYFNVRYQVKPFMLWIWFSVLLISFGGLMSFFKK